MKLMNYVLNSKICDRETLWEAVKKHKLDKILMIHARAFGRPEFIRLKKKTNGGS